MPTGTGISPSVVAATMAGTLIAAIASGAAQGPASARATAGKQANARNTVLDGVYTVGQAERGGLVYGDECAACHEGADVDGPPLTGAPFIDRWREDALDRLFEFIKTRMPQSEPGSLSDQTYVDILGHLLHENSFPAGPRELTTEALASTLFVGLNGPQPLPNGALVSVVGCLAHSASREWTIMRAGGLARVRAGNEITPAEASAAAGAVLGTLTFTLQNVGDGGTPLPGNGSEGQKIVVKGALTQRPGSGRIHVTAAASVAVTCA